MLLCLLAALKCEDERRIAAARSKGQRPSLFSRASARSSERLSARISP